MVQLPFCWQSYKSVFLSPLFQLKAGALAFNFAGLFLYVAAAPVFLTQHLKLGPDQFAWQFVPAVSGIFLGALAANRLAGNATIARQVNIGYWILISAAAANVLYHSFYPPALPWSVMFLFFYTFGMSMIAPSVTLIVLDLFPDIHGIVASCQSFTQTMLGAVVAGVVAPILSTSVLLLAAGQLACGLVGLALWLGGRRYHAKQAEEHLSLNAWEAVE